MKFQTDPMLVAGYGYWEIDGEKVVNRDKEPVEYIQLIDLEADEIHRFTIKGVNPSDRPEPMTYAKVTCEARTAQKGRDDGSVSSRLKVQVVAIEKAAAPSEPRAASKTSS